MKINCGKKNMLFNGFMSGFVKSQVLRSGYKINSASLVKGLIVLVKLSHNDKLESQDTML